MKKIFFVLLLALPALTGYAQQYSFVKTLNERALRVIPAQNGNFYSISLQTNCPDDHIVIRYFNRAGDVLKTSRSPVYLGHINTLDATVINNNHLVLYLRDGDINHLLYEFDTTGTIVWNNNIQFTNPVVKYTRIIPSGNNGFYLTGYTFATIWTDSTRAIITKLSSAGKHEWTKFYRMSSPNPASTRFNDVMLENNSLIVAGRYYYTAQMIGQAPFRPIIMKLDTAGNIQQSYYYMVDSNMIGLDEYEFMKIDKTPAGHYYLLGNNFGNEHAFFKMNSSFDIEWIRESLSGKSVTMCAGYDEELWIVPEYPKSNFILKLDSAGLAGVNHITKNPQSGFALQYGQTGDLVRHDCGYLMSNDQTMYAHLPKSMTYCLDSTATNVGNYYAVPNHYRRNCILESGNLNSFNEYLSLQQYTPETSTATMHCSSAYNCTGVPNSINEMTETELSIYPLPADANLFLNLGNELTQKDISLYDMNAGIVYKESFAKGGIVRIETQNFAEGIYVLKISAGKKITYKKVEVIH